MIHSRDIADLGQLDQNYLINRITNGTGDKTSSPTQNQQQLELDSAPKNC